MLEKEITQDNISLLVNNFYTKVLENEVLAPFFIKKLGKRMDSKVWQKHLTLISDFWYSMATGKGTYNGSPFAPHVQIEGLEKETFQMWLKIFFETLDEIFEENIANAFKERSSMIAANFMRNLSID
ncbi:MAG: group III truncated hemoglobin [Campylobacteraceae bacterium]|nr:group III truncated hemoglobin [Campylobacteraceae bacterium]